MEREESFDSFYLTTRRQVLHQTFALTGDLLAAQSAVRDAYVAAWHHWRKVAPLDDPQSWVRPHAWQLAQRRHAGRIWHRNKGLAEEHLTVLDALSKLSSPQRRDPAPHPAGQRLARRGGARARGHPGSSRTDTSRTPPRPSPDCSMSTAFALRTAAAGPRPTPSTRSHSPALRSCAAPATSAARLNTVVAAITATAIAIAVGRRRVRTGSGRGGPGRRAGWRPDACPRTTR